MKPHPRIRKAIKWSGAAVTVLLVVVWIGSGWCISHWQRKNHVEVFILSGRLVTSWASSDSLLLDLHAAQKGNRPFHIEWGFNLRVTPASTSIAVPLWTVALAMLAATAVAWRRDALAGRRARLNLCPKCNYDRAGIVAGVKCPECGSLRA